MNLYFKKYLFLLLVLLNAFFLKASNNPMWVDSLIKEGTAYLIQAQKDNLIKSDNNNYTIILDAKKWLGELPDNSDSYSPSLQQNKWHYETGTAYSLTDGISEQQIESRLDSFNTARPTGDNVRFYSILIKNFPVKVNNTIASLPNIDSSKNLFNQLVALKVIDKAYYNNVVRNTFKAVIDKIVSDAQAQFTYQELAVYGIGHMVVTYGTNSEDVIGFMAQYPVLKGGRLDSPQTNEYIRTSFNQIANKTTTPRKKTYEMISVWAESIHCVVDGNCAPLAEPGNTYYNTWKNKQGVSQALIRLTAQYINLLKANLYNDFKTVRDVPSPSWTNAQFENYKTQVSMFYRYYQHFNEKIDSIGTAKDIIVLCKHLTTNQYQLFTAQQRLKILSKINESSLTDLQNSLSFLNNGYGGENIAVKLVKYAPASQSTVLLAGLKQNNLLNNLLDKLDDAGIEADNFTQFVFGILNLIPQSSFDGNWDNLINNNKVFKGDFSGSLLAGNAFTINLNEQNNNGTLKVITIVGYLDFIEKTLSPFEPVGIIADAPLPLYAPIANSNGYYAAAVPALYLYWLMEKAETQAAYKAVNVTINVLGFVTGVGVAANAATTTVRILGVLDATAGALAVGFDVLPIEQTIVDKYGSNSPEHDFIKKIQLGLTIYNGVSAGANLLQLPQKLDEAVIYWNQNKQRLKDDLAVTQQQSNQIDDLLMEVNIKQTGGSVFGKNVISGINGFSDNITSILSQRGLSLNDFKLLQQKRYDLMTLAEKIHIDAIRNSIPMPDGSTLLQKVIPKNDITKYTSGQYTQIGGFVSTAKDAKHLNSFDDIYAGMRLDYKVNGVQPIKLSDGSCGVIRYKTAFPNLSVPKIPEVTSDLPYTGNGFTGGNSGQLGVPEWKSPYNTPDDGAELWEVFSNGSEVLRARFSTAQNKFIPLL